MVMTNLYLISETYLRQDSVDNIVRAVTRPGYRLPHSDDESGENGPIYAALLKWNHLDDQMGPVLLKGVSYVEKFGRL